MAPALLPGAGMRRDVVGLGVVLAVSGLAYGSSRVTIPAEQPGPARVGSIIALEPGVRPPASTASNETKRRRSVRPENPGSIARHVHDAAARYGLPVSLVAALISVESEFNPRAVSHRGALGLMQLMPTTAALLGVRDAFDPKENVDAGARHLRQLLDRFSNDVPLALAAYNAGSLAVIKHGGVPPYPETRAFIARVLGRIGQVMPPTVVVAAAASAPRIRMARSLSDPLRSREREPIIIPIVLSEDTPARPVVEPSPPARAPRWRELADAAPVTGPTALARPEAP